MITSRTTNSQPGQCYPRETLVGLLHLCASKGIHLISDEIYALSVYSRYDREPEKFTSIRAIDPAGIIDPNQVHVLYGLSKVSNVSLVIIKFKVLMRSPGLHCKRDAVRLHYIPKSRFYKGHACCLVSDLYRIFAKWLLIHFHQSLLLAFSIFHVSSHKTSGGPNFCLAIY